jgi:phosphohistidine phosphatase
VLRVELYLMRHAEAMAEAEDPRRPLTEAGRAAAERVAARAAAAGACPDRVYHSDAVRAQQTAVILAERLGAADRMEAWPELGEDARDVGMAARRLRAAAEEHGAVALVGHMPLLARLASHLVAGDEGAGAVQFTPGALVKLVAKESDAGFAVAWALPPELA